MSDRDPAQKKDLHLSLYQQGLSSTQRAVVEHPLEGPGQLVIAGAGSGKTRTVMARIERLINEGVDPKSILALTFSRRAAQELQHRAYGQLKEVQWTTLHSWGNHMLEASSGKRMTVLSSFRAWRAFKDLSFNNNTGFSSGQLWKVWQALQKLKAHPVPPSNWHVWFQTQRVERAQVAADLAVLYERHKRASDLIDYDDMLYGAWQLLSIASERERFLSSLRYVFIDEVQDLNPIQITLCDLLSSQAQMCAVGDLAQSIYSFRHAEPAAVLLYARRHSLQRRLLPENFRCGRAITQAANSLIDAMSRVVPVFAAVPVSKAQGQISAEVVESHEREAARLVELVSERLLLGHRADQNAVLCRTRAQMARVEHALSAAKIQYTTLGAGFFDSHEVQQSLAMLKLANKPEHMITVEDLEAFSTIPPCGLPTNWKTLVGDGVGAIGRIDLIARARRITGWQGLQELASRWRAVSRQSKGGADAARGLQSIYALADPRHSWQTFYQWGSFTDVSEPDDKRSDNLDALHDLAIGRTVTDLLDSLPRSSSGGVVVGTVHRAKGLEYDAVYLPGWSQKLFPHERCPLEEERRLAYVAITRARELVWIGVPQHRKKGRALDPSQFIKELGL